MNNFPRQSKCPHKKALLLLMIFFLVPNASADLQKDLQTFRPSLLGVDAAGHLWTWSAAAKEARALTTDGRWTSVVLRSPVGAVDVNTIWGVASLGVEGDILRVTNWKGLSTFAKKLTDVGARVCWIDEQRIAVSHRLNAAISVWNIGTGERESVIGELTPLTIAPGARFANAVHIKYDARRQELVTFDAYFGRLTRYVAAGTRTLSATVPHPGQSSTDAWIKKLDAQHKRQGTVFRPLMWSYPTLSLDEKGTAWVADAAEANAASLIGITRDGKILKKNVPTRCPSIRFEIWRGKYYFYRDPQSPRAYCIDEKRM